MLFNNSSDDHYLQDHQDCHAHLWHLGCPDLDEWDGNMIRNRHQNCTLGLALNLWKISNSAYHDNHLTTHTVIMLYLKLIQCNVYVSFISIKTGVKHYNRNENLHQNTKTVTLWGHENNLMEVTRLLEPSFKLRTVFLWKLYSAQYHDKLPLGVKY